MAQRSRLSNHEALSSFISTDWLTSGVSVVRDEVVRFIKARDGYDSDPENIFLTDGASPAVAHMLFALISKPNVGVSLAVSVLLRGDYHVAIASVVYIGQ